MLDSESPYLAPRNVSGTNRVNWALVISLTTTVVLGTAIIATEMSFGMSMLTQLLLNIAVPGLFLATVPYYFFARRWQLGNGGPRPVAKSCLIAFCGAFQTIGCLSVAIAVTRLIPKVFWLHRVFAHESFLILISPVVSIIAIYTFLVVVSMKFAFRHDYALSPTSVSPIFVGVAAAAFEVYVQYNIGRYSIFYPLMAVSRYALLLSWLAHWNCVSLLFSKRNEGK